MSASGVEPDFWDDGQAYFLGPVIDIIADRPAARSTARSGCVMAGRSARLTRDKLAASPGYLSAAADLIDPSVVSR